MNAPELKPNLINGKVVAENVQPEVYLRQVCKRGEKDFVMSRGELMEFNHCPRRWLAGVLTDETKATEWGSLIDALLFDDEFESRFVVAPETYPDKKGQPKKWNWNAAFCDEWREQQGGKKVLKAAEFLDAEAAVSRLLNDEQVSRLVEVSRRQVMVIAEYEHRASGVTVPLKVLLDLLPPADDEVFGKDIVDLKTCRNAAPENWARAVFNSDYHVQAAMQLDVYCAATGEDRCTFRHLLQENFAPWEIGKQLLSEEFIQFGRQKYVLALRRYCECLASGNWPGYDEEGRARQTFDGWQLTEPEPWMVQ